MIYWKIRFTNNNQINEYDNYYENASIEKQERMYKRYREIREKCLTKNPLTCISNFFSGEECGVTVVIRNTIDSKNMYELAKLKGENHQ